MASDADPNARYRARPGQEVLKTPFKEAYANAREDWEKRGGKPTFEYDGKTYSVASREEATRQKEMRESSMRGRGYGQPARTPSGRAEIPTGGSAKAPAEGAEGMSEAQRNAMNMLMAIPPARAVGQAVRGGLRAAEAAAAARRAGAAERRIEPMMATGRVRETGQFRSGSPSLREAQREAAEEMAREPALKKGGKVKAYAKGGSVRGGGCESRTKKTKYV